METSCVILPYIILGICEVCGAEQNWAPKPNASLELHLNTEKVLGNMYD